VAVAARELGQAQAVGLDHAHPGAIGALEELPHACILSRRIRVQLDDGLRRRPEAHAHGMESE